MQVFNVLHDYNRFCAVFMCITCGDLNTISRPRRCQINGLIVFFLEVLVGYDQGFFLTICGCSISRLAGYGKTYTTRVSCFAKKQQHSNPLCKLYERLASETILSM